MVSNKAFNQHSWPRGFWLGTSAQSTLNQQMKQQHRLSLVPPMEQFFTGIRSVRQSFLLVKKQPYRLLFSLGLVGRLGLVGS